MRESTVTRIFAARRALRTGPPRLPVAPARATWIGDIFELKVKVEINARSFRSLVQVRAESECTGLDREGEKLGYKENSSAA